jgi:hypothetical protein
MPQLMAVLWPSCQYRDSTVLPQEGREHQYSLGFKAGLDEVIWRIIRPVLKIEHQSSSPANYSIELLYEIHTPIYARILAAEMLVMSTISNKDGLDQCYIYLAFWRKYTWFDFVQVSGLSKLWVFMDLWSLQTKSPATSYVSVKWLSILWKRLVIEHSSSTKGG